MHAVLSNLLQKYFIIPYGMYKNNNFATLKINFYNLSKERITEHKVWSVGFKTFLWVDRIIFCLVIKLKYLFIAVLKQSWSRFGYIIHALYLRYRQLSCPVLRHYFVLVILETEEPWLRFSHSYTKLWMIPISFTTFISKKQFSFEADKLIYWLQFWWYWYLLQCCKFF